MKKTILTGIIAIILLLTGCGAAGSPAASESKDVIETEPIVILYTNDVHCAAETGIGYAGLAAYKKEMEEEGNAVFLIDEGDAVQGGIMGSLTKGEAIIRLMNEVGYDLAIPGNHEFDYGVPRFLELTGMADFPYICCNFKDIREDKLVLAPYLIREIGGKRIGVVGALTPQTVLDGTPLHFQDEEGRYIYDFGSGEDGAQLYRQIQEAVDAVHEEGVDYTILAAHLGILESSRPFTSVDVIRNTTGIDVVLDGHSHSTVSMELVKNKDGRNVILTQTGTQLKSIGKLTIDESGKISTELITDWEKKDESILAAIEREKNAYKDKIEEPITHADFELIVNEGNIRLARNNETNLGDLVADAFRAATGADIAIINSGAMLHNLPAGTITYGDILNMMPYINEMCVIRVKGQTIADVLEFGASFAPEQHGGFMQVSGICFDVDLDKDPQVRLDKNGLFEAFGSDERRVSNIRVGGEPLDPEREYTVGGTRYVLQQQGAGITQFDGAEEVHIDGSSLDIDAVAEYLRSMKEGVPEEYADRYGQERIRFMVPGTVKEK